MGRSAAGRALDPDAVTRAVVASVRHKDTAYDELLMAGVPRQKAWERIRSNGHQGIGNPNSSAATGQGSGRDASIRGTASCTGSSMTPYR